jgi:hypothetical protein
MRGETMQAAQLTIGNSTVTAGRKISQLSSSSVTGIGSASVTGRIGTLVARVFGCRHAEMSRPFSRDGRAYRSCLNCGAQRQFNLSNWQMQGSFYYGRPQPHQFPAA